MLDLLDALTSDQPERAATARFFATGIAQTTHDWLDAEADRQTEPVTVMLAATSQFAFCLSLVMAAAATVDVDREAFVAAIAQTFAKFLRAALDAHLAAGFDDSADTSDKATS